MFIFVKAVQNVAKVLVIAVQNVAKILVIAVQIVVIFFYLDMFSSISFCSSSLLGK